MFCPLYLLLVCLHALGDDIVLMGLARLNRQNPRYFATLNRKGNYNFLTDLKNNHTYSSKDLSFFHICVPL